MSTLPEWADTPDAAADYYDDYDEALAEMDAERRDAMHDEEERR